MRPVRLTAVGFMTFRDLVEIDFTGADFFALVGETGSGKSSVLDAICFALYGSVPRYDDDRLVAPADQELANRVGAIVATTLLAKSVVPEQTEGFVGVYAGERSVPAVKKGIEEADADRWRRTLAAGNVAIEEETASRNGYRDDCGRLCRPRGHGDARQGARRCAAL